MLSKREEERNEKIIRGLMKLPPNRRCINCNSLGPQYVCTNFWTFVCMTCSGIHREFTHRVKSVSMAKFTTQEVEVLQRGGNQRAREMFLKDWDTQRMRLPDSSNADKIREFIKNVYVHKKYAGGKSSDKPPRDLQSLKNHEEYQRKASSYHSFSQSPPYEHQYEDRRYGKKQTITLTRRPGSDRGLFGGTVSSFVYSPGHLREHMHDEKFSNESSGSRFSDYSESSTGDPFRYDSQSPNFQDSGHSSPTLHQVRDIFVENAQPQMFNKYSDANVKRDLGGISRPQRTASAGSFGSIDSNSESNKSVNSGNAISAVLEPEHPTGTQRATASTFPYLSQSSTSRLATNQDLVCLPFVQPSATSSAPMLDLFADISHQPSSTTFLEQKPSAVSFSANEGWATFDLPQPAGSASETNKGVSAMVTPSDGAPKGTEDALASMLNNSQWFSVQNSAVLGPFTSATDQLHIGLHEDKRSVDQKGSQSWNAFDDSTGNMPHSSFGSLPQKNELQIPVWKSPTSDDPYIGLKTSEGLFNNKFRKSALDDTVPGLNLPSTGVSRSSFPPSVLPPTAGASHAPKSTNPFDIPYDLDSEANNAFLDMSSLQAALPNPQLPTAFLGGLPQQWFPQSSVSQGGLAYMAGQPPRAQLPNLPPQGSVASLGGNPFA